MKTRQPKPTCTRCDKPRGARWEEQWPNHGTIEMGVDCQSFMPLTGADVRYQRDEEDAAWAFWKNDGMGLFKTFEAQKVVLEWGDQEDYRLCRECQRSLLRVIGQFFKMPERAKEIARAKQEPSP